jgi:hypothetical protein
MGAVDGAAKMVKAQFDKAQDIQNHTDISTKHREIRDAKGEFMNEMAGVNEDGTMGQAVPPAEWGPKWSQRLKTLEGKLGLDKTPPVVRRAVEDKFKDFTSSSYIEIAGAAIKANRREAAQNLDRDIADAKQRGDYGAVDQLLAEAGDIIPAEQISDARRSNRTAQSTAARADEMNEDPAAFIERMEGKGGDGLHSGVVRREIRAAKAIMNRDLEEDMDMVSESVEAGEIADPADIEARLKKIPNIKEHQIKKLLASYKEDTPLTKVERGDYRARLRELKANYIETKDFEAYDDGWRELLIELTAEGKRVGAGDLRGMMYQVTPDIWTKNAGQLSTADKAAQKEQFADVDDLASDIARSFGTEQKNKMLMALHTATGGGTTSGAWDKNAPSGSGKLTEEQELANIKLKRDADIHGANLEGIAETSMKDFIQNYSRDHGRQPVLHDLMDHMEKVVMPMMQRKLIGRSIINLSSGNSFNSDNDSIFDSMGRERTTPQTRDELKAEVQQGMFELEDDTKDRLKALKK